MIIIYVDFMMVAITINWSCLLTVQRSVIEIYGEFWLMLLYLPMIITVLPSLYLIKIAWILCSIIIAITNGFWLCWIRLYRTWYDSLWISFDMKQSCYCLTRFYGKMKQSILTPVSIKLLLIFFNWNDKIIWIISNLFLMFIERKLDLILLKRFDLISILSYMLF